MSGHVYEQCRQPRWAWRWRNRVWVCDCGKAYVPQVTGASDRTLWGWRPWMTK